MKVVLFCGGFGTRLREHSETMPKPLVNIGYRPIIWHLMRYYAYFGHKDFVLCLGYRGDAIREYFLTYSETLTNDFTLSNGGKTVELHATDIEDWRITFVETGLHSNIGQRLLAVRKYVGNEEVFLANYSDGLSDLPLNELVDEFVASDAVGSFAAVPSPESFHAATVNKDKRVTNFGRVGEQEMLLNGGFFAFRRAIFDYIQPGEELVEEPFQRLVAEGRLMAFKHGGFWQSMDSLKDKISFDRMYASGDSPWELWN
jgi:glucose-1-phosphate cytidylyltransferase